MGKPRIRNGRRLHQRAVCLGGLPRALDRTIAAWEAAALKGSRTRITRTGSAPSRTCHAGLLDHRRSRKVGRDRGVAGWGRPPPRQSPRHHHGMRRCTADASANAAFATCSASTSRSSGRGWGVLRGLSSPRRSAPRERWE